MDGVSNFLAGLMVLILGPLGFISGPAKHDGTKTGPIVGYQSFCSPEKGIFQIYENETLPFTLDGKQIFMTNDDIECYKQKQVEANNSAKSISNTEGSSGRSVNNKAQAQQLALAHDGSRTGKIVSYNEYCTGKQISVYENELITKVSNKDGKTYSMTKQDWVCYENNYVATKPQNTQSQQRGSSLVSVPCVTSTGTYTEYGNSYEEALKACTSFQAWSREQDADAQQRLEWWKNQYKKLDEINSRTFQLSPVPTIAPISAPAQIIQDTRRDCAYARNSYGAVAQVCTCTDSLGNTYACQ